MLLNLVFQFGNFSGSGNQWYYDVMVGMIGGLVGVAGAYGLYRHQIKQIREDRLKYVATLLSSIVSHINKQAKNCTDLAQELSISPTRFKLLSFEANYDLTRLTEKVDQEGFYHAYLWKYGRLEQSYKDFKKLYGYLDFIHASIDQLIDFVEKENQGINRRKHDFKGSLDSTMIYFQELLLMPVIRQYPNNLAQELNNILDRYRQNFQDIEDLTYPNTHFITVLSNYISIQNNVPHVIPEITELVKLLLKTSDIFNGIESAGRSFGTDLQSYNKVLAKAASDFETITSQLRKDYAIRS